MVTSLDNIRKRIIGPRKNVVGGGGHPPLDAAALKKMREVQQWEGLEA